LVPNKLARYIYKYWLFVFIRGNWSLLTRRAGAVITNELQKWPRSLAKVSLHFCALHVRMSITRALREYLFIIPDKPGRLAARMKVRPQHLADLPNVIKATKDGRPFLAHGGGLATEFPKSEKEKPDFQGSVLTVAAQSRQEAIDFLKRDVYYSADVWDFDNAKIYAVSIEHYN
jgi:hypothetical protein